MAAWQRLRAYAANDDPLAAACNLIALAVAGNQPVYPLYVQWLAGEGGAVACLTFLSTPFFLAVPAVARRHGLAGRCLLPIVGMANAVLCTKLFGIAAGVELFLLPCVTIAMLAVRRAERIVGLVVAGAAFVLFAGLHDRYGAPVVSFSAESLSSLLQMNAFSVGALSVLVGIVFVRAFESVGSGR